MNLDEIVDLNLKNHLTNFINKYGLTALNQALDLYISMKNQYICKNKSLITRIKISDIYYMEIRGHNITIYTNHGIYHKRGTLKKELETLAFYKFVRCNQSCIVAIMEVKSICNNDIILSNDAKLHMSRRYAPKVLAAFSSCNYYAK